jgi:hypothetical protein
MRTLVALLLLSTIPAAAGVEDTLAQREGWAAYQASLDEEVAEVNAACGSRLTGAYNKASYPEFDPLKDRTQAACELAVGTLSALCATETGKASVKALERVACRYSTAGTRAGRREAVLQIDIDPAKTSIVGELPGSYSWKSALSEAL